MVKHPSNTDMELYFPTNWSNCYFENQLINNISVPALGDKKVEITYSIPNITSNHLPKILITPCTNSASWTYVTWFVSELTQTSCKLCFHSLENETITFGCAVFITF